MAVKICRKQVETIKIVLIKIDKFSFLIDFMVPDVEENLNIPFILRRPYMETARILVDIDKDQLKVRIKDCMNVFRL